MPGANINKWLHSGDFGRRRIDQPNVLRNLNKTRQAGARSLLFQTVLVAVRAFIQGARECPILFFLGLSYDILLCASLVFIAVSGSRFTIFSCALPVSSFSDSSTAASRRYDSLLCASFGLFF